MTWSCTSVRVSELNHYLVDTNLKICMTFPFRSGENRTTMHKCYTFLIFMVLLLPSLGLSRYFVTLGLHRKVRTTEKNSYPILTFQIALTANSIEFSLLMRSIIFKYYVFIRHQHSSAIFHKTTTEP